jgi:hypothetical protein
MEKIEKASDLRTHNIKERRKITKSVLEYYDFCHYFAYRIVYKPIRPKEMTYHWPLKSSMQLAATRVLELNATNDKLSREEIEDVFLKHWIQRTSKSKILFYNTSEARVVTDAVNTLKRISDTLPLGGSCITHSDHIYWLDFTFTRNYESHIIVSGKLAAMGYETNGKSGKSYIISAHYPLTDIQPSWVSHYIPTALDYTAGSRIHRSKTNDTIKIFIDLRRGTISAVDMKASQSQRVKHDVYRLTDIRDANIRNKRIGSHCQYCPMYSECINPLKYTYI